MMKKSTEGFTLIELVVGILCATLITGAAMSLMLMGLRNAQSLTDANTNLQNSRIILTMVEKMASEGIVKGIQVYDGDVSNEDGTNYGDETGHHDWSLLDEDDNVILHYSSADQAIYGQGSSALMENVTASSLTLSKAPMGGSLLGCTIACDDGVYETAAYSRHEEIESEGIVLDKNDITITDTARPDAPDYGGVEVKPEETPGFVSTVKDGRTALLSILSSQYGSSGEIIGFFPTVHFSQWYIGGYNPQTKPDWNEDTPWCACFVSWGSAVINNQAGTNPYLEVVPSFASVNNGWNDAEYDGKTAFAAKYWQEDRGNWNGGWSPAPGDFVFFDWDGDSTKTNADLEHIGVVFYADQNYIYTIEGNSNDKVAIQRYKADSDLIYGYSVLKWLR